MRPRPRGADGKSRNVNNQLVPAPRDQSDGWAVWPGKALGAGKQAQQISDKTDTHRAWGRSLGHSAGAGGRGDLAGLLRT